MHPDKQYDLAPAGPNYILGAIVGGAIAAILSAPVNCCCFLFAFVGGGVAALVAQRQAARFTVQEGAISGGAAAMTGWLGYGVLYAILTTTMAKYIKQHGLPPGFPQVPGFDMEQAFLQNAAPGAMLTHLGMALVVFLFFSVGGGALAGMWINRAPYDNDPQQW